jgi:integrase
VYIIENLDYYINNHKQYTFIKSGSLFLSQRNEPIYSYHPITRCFETALKKLGIRYRQPYQMRHSFACNALAAGEDPNWVKNMLGHSNLEMLFKIYGNWYQPSQNIRAGSKFQSNVAKRLPSQK